MRLHGEHAAYGRMAWFDRRLFALWPVPRRVAGGDGSVSENEIL